MKTKKALAVILAVVMLVMPFAVSSFAATSEIIAEPYKTAYNDSECFIPQGLVVNVDGVDIDYTPIDAKFRFIPSLDELLTVETTKVDVYYDNELVGSIPVTVEHILGEITVVGNGHGRYCLGCGTLHNFEKHYDYSAGSNPNECDDKADYDYVSEWIPNDDGGLFVQQTATGVCSICNAEVTKNIAGSETFGSIFEGETMSEIEAMILSYINMILVPLIQMLVGIS
ncbi:MAG: hypothetical protein IJN94_02390 [Clostridia bacterium]|nr:hypothetical protein [Clostridia bacterium]